MLHQFTRSNCMLWDYWFGWVKNIYDSVIFQFWRIKHTFVEVKLKLYIIIGDIAHPVRQWMYCLFEGVNIALLERKKKLVFFSIFELDTMWKLHLIFWSVGGSWQGSDMR